MINPDIIAEWVSTDKSKNLIVESLFGYRVNAGDSQIDRLILMVDQAFLDWNLNNKKFKDLVIKFFGKMPTEQEWLNLINDSNQSTELKDRLINLITSNSKSTSLRDQPPRNIIIHHKDTRINRGAGPGKIVCSDIRDSGKDFFYCAIGKPGKYERWVRGGFGKWRKVAPDWFLGFTGGYKKPQFGQKKYFIKYNSIITIKKGNILKIDGL